MLPALIDCRRRQAYQAGHLPDSCHIPAAELFQRMHELPKREVPVQLVVDAESQHQALAFFQDKGYMISELINWADISQELAQQAVCGCDSKRLWQPNPLLVQFCDQAHTMGITPGTGLDIGCGAGRDMVYLALQGWQMAGIDHNADAIKRSQHLAEVNDVTLRLEQLNLETDEIDSGATIPPMLTANSQDLIIVLRYLHRPLMPLIRQALRPGGVIIYQTFMQGCELIGRPRNPRFLLKPGELVETFSGFEIMTEQQIELSDGRPLSGLIARKPKADHAPTD